jgi:CBS domain-containing protein
MHVKDLMTPEVITLDPDDDLALAERLMGESRIRHLPVVDEQFKLVGLVSQRDVLRASLSSLHVARGADKRMKADVQLQQIMCTQIDTCAPDDPLKTVVDRMRAKKYGCLPVINAEGRLVGIITDTDFLRFSSAVLEVLEDQEVYNRINDVISPPNKSDTGSGET